jgi:glucose 1-dehydrogenase
MNSSQNEPPQVLAGQVAVVTGAGRGIGRAVAIALAQAGATVAVNDLPSAADLESTIEAIRSGGGRAVASAFDVTDQATVEQEIGKLIEREGRLDIAVTNAAYSDREPFHTANMAGFHRTIDVTMWGSFYVMRAAAAHMVRTGTRGSLVAISSPHADNPIPRAMAYNMAKAAVDQMARTAAIELATHGIRVNIIHPGWIDTPGERKFFSNEQIQTSATRLPWGRLGKPEEIARGVVFLCDPASDYITGSTFRIDGGINLPWWASRGSGAP